MDALELLFLVGALRVEQQVQEKHDQQALEAFRRHRKTCGRDEQPPVDWVSHVGEGARRLELVLFAVRLERRRRAPLELVVARERREIDRRVRAAMKGAADYSAKFSCGGTACSSADAQ